MGLRLARNPGCAREAQLDRGAATLVSETGRKKRAPGNGGSDFDRLEENGLQKVNFKVPTTRWSQEKRSTLQLPAALSMLVSQ